MKTFIYLHIILFLLFYIFFTHKKMDNIENEYKDIKGKYDYIIIKNKKLNYENNLLRIRNNLSKNPQLFDIIEITFKLSSKHNIDPYLILSIIQTESNFNTNAKSSNSYGLMQINYNIWKKELNIDKNKIYDINYNIELGIKILKIYLKLSNNDIQKALHYYNNGTSSKYNNINYHIKVKNFYVKNFNDGVFFHK